MNQENILSVKLDRKDKSQKVTMKYFYPENGRNREEDITDVPHQDFFTALMQLSPFLARIFYASEDNHKNYTATGITFSKENCVIISGKMATASGSVIGIATPAINLESLELYPSFEEIDGELNDVVANLAMESLLLLNGTKLGVKQLDMIEEIDKAEAEKLDIGIFTSDEGIVFSTVDSVDDTPDVDDFIK